MNQSPYFSHDCDTTTDIKIEGMLRVYGAEGYAIFWRVVEMLHKESSHKLPLKPYIYEAIAGRFLMESNRVQEIIEAMLRCFDLFKFDENFLWSERVQRNVDDFREKKNNKSSSGKKGGINSGKSRRTKQTLKQNEAPLQIIEAPLEANEAKEKKRKEKKEEENSLKENPPPQSPPQILPEISATELTDFQVRLLGEQILMESLMVPRRLDYPTMTKWVKQFNAHIAGEGKLDKNYEDYRVHFKRWFVKQDTTQLPIGMNGNGNHPILGSHIKTSVDTSKYVKNGGRV